MTEMTDLGRVTTWTTHQVQEHLAASGFHTTSLEYLGSGHWSDCFGFVSGGRDLVVRIGTHVEDFRKDQLAYELAGSTAAIPRVLAIGPLSTEPDARQFWAVSERAWGQPLEQVTHWPTGNVIVADLLDGLRKVDVSSISGWGLWSSSKTAQSTSWRDFLLRINRDEPDSRVHGWSSALAQWPQAQAVFDRWYEFLASSATSDVPRGMIHNDLYHRNVHVHNGAITGVFDWGNALIGDHLYDVAMLCFWSPWFEHLDEQIVLDELFRRWHASDTMPINFDERLRSCMLHMGLEHIAYHAFLNNHGEAMRVCRRLDQVATKHWR